MPRLESSRNRALIFLPPNDKGRFAVTKTVSDEYVFRVPELRNIELTPPYFHTGQVWDLTQAVGVMATEPAGQDAHRCRGLEDHGLPQLTNRRAAASRRTRYCRQAVATTPQPQP